MIEAFGSFHRDDEAASSGSIGWRTRPPRATHNYPKPYWKIAHLELPHAAAKIAGRGAGYRLKIEPLRGPGVVLTEHTGDAP